MRPRIALVSNYPADHRTFCGGVETATAALLEGLRLFQGEFEFHVIALSRSLRVDCREERDGFYFHFLSLPNAAWLPARFPIRIVKVYQEVRSIKPSLIHCHANLLPALGLTLTAHPRVLTLHGIASREARLRPEARWTSAAWRIIERYVIPRFDAVICISDYARTFVGPRQATFAIPNAVDSSFFVTSTDGRDMSSPYFLFVGEISPLKRPLDVLLAHEGLRRDFPNVELLLCGHMGDVGYARELIRVLRERGVDGVRFLGQVSRQVVRDLLRGATGLVLPSAQENAPMIIGEAMAMGVPVVATRVGGVGDMVVDGETGILFPVGDLASLGKALRLLLLDPTRRDALGCRARSVARVRYAPEHVAEATVQVYQQLLREGTNMRITSGHDVIGEGVTS